MKLKIKHFIGILFFVIGCYVFYNCSNKVDKELCNQCPSEEENQGTQINLQSLINPGFNTIVNLIDLNECFACKAQYSAIAENMKHVNLPETNKIYVFPTLRDIEQKRFLMDNFGFERDDPEVTILFNSHLYTSLMKTYHLSFTSCILYFDSSFNVISTQDYSEMKVL